MASTIKIKNSSTAGAAPTASDLVQGELAVNVTDKRIYTENASGTVVELGTNPSVPVTFPDGSASAPSLTNDGDTNTGVFFPAADTVGITTGGTERVRVDSSGNVGVGVTPSNAWASTTSFETQSFNLNSVSTSDARFMQNAYYNVATSAIYKTTNAASMYRQASGEHQWFNAASGTAGNAITWTQAMTLDASGNLLVGMTSAIGTERINIQGKTGSGQDYNILTAGATAIANTFAMRMYSTTSSSVVGSIQFSSSATSYNTSSDYRLKNTVVPMTGALDKVTALKPVTYKWNVDGSDGEGFIAHELAEVCPQAVSGEKDAVNEDGSIKPQGIDTSFLVATLTAAIQELKAELDAAKARITTLEAA